jgi:3-methylcrotonyl-CoA carboxylase beta subunit
MAGSGVLVVGMATIESRFVASSEEACANAAAMAELVADLRRRRSEAAEGGSKKARERHKGRGKLLPRQRIASLIDPGSPFLELSPMAAHGMYGEAIHAGGILTGIGRIRAASA